MPTNALCTEWLELQDALITVDQVNNTLGAINDDAWVAAACVDKVLDDVVVERALLDLGIERTVAAAERSKNAMVTLIVPEEEEDQEDELTRSEAESRRASLMTHYTMHPTDELLCRLRILLLERLDRLQTYVEMSKIGMDQTEKNVKDESMDAWDEDDPWEETEDGGLEKVDDIRNASIPYFSLSSFLQRELIHSAFFLASNVHIEALSILLRRHAKYLHAYHLRILEHIPEHVHPSDFQVLLPAIDPLTELQADTLDTPWRGSMDWTETAECTSAFTQVYAVKEVPPSTPHSISDVSQWYQNRITQADNAGLVDVALALVQHGASQGVPELDALGEELGLLSRLVYDAPRPLEEEVEEDEWTLARWRTLRPTEVVRGYLAHTAPETVVNDIRRLVMPYLYVLEARAERAGQPDPGIVNRLFYEYILQVPLEISAMIFNASKPTLPAAERLVKNDEDMARLALACLYGSEDRDNWAVMSRIFECLPVWSELNADESDEADTTLASLADFVIPTTSRPRCTPSELFIFFSPLTVSALSHILDILDVQLESGEILSRWDVPAPLRWFLQSANDAAQQRSWATRMSRRGGRGGDELKDENEWLELLDDMLKLVGEGSGASRGAFSLLTKEDVTRIFFSGLLGSGNFRVAKSILRKSRMQYLSDPQIIENQVLASAREFYDNASVGNFHQGEMRLAYECLTVAKPSPAIQREREFIEATSRICSFNVVSRPGIPISPIEIRLEKDRLTLVARVLSSTEDAYKHSGVILDLAHKLGYRDDVAAEVKVRAMLADAALHAEDFDRAAEATQQMIDIIRKMNHVSDEEENLKEAREICWHSCFQLGRQTEFNNVEKKLSLLGHALEICSPEHMLDVLSVWRKLEGQNLVARQEKLADRKGNAASRKRRRAESSTAVSIRARLQDLQHLGASTGISAPDAAALATRTLKSVAASFPFSVRGRQSDKGRPSQDVSSSNGHEADLRIPDVSTHAKQAFSRGIGWLIGADEE